MSELERPVVTFGVRVQDHLTITVLGRKYPDAKDAFDGNWLAALIELQAGGFAGTVRASLRAEELQAFRCAVNDLWTSLSGDAILRSMEEWITLRLTVDGSGHVAAAGTLLDKPGNGNKLSFTLTDLDQSYLPGVIDALDDVQFRYPEVPDLSGSVGGSSG